MKPMKKSDIARLAFAGATAVALAFGVTEAFAAPAQPTDARACSIAQCNAFCYPFKGECRGQCLCAG